MLFVTPPSCISNLINLSIDAIFSVPDRPLQIFNLYTPLLRISLGKCASNLYLPGINSERFEIKLLVCNNFYLTIGIQFKSNID